MKKVSGFIHRHLMLFVTLVGLLMAGSYLWALHPNELELFELSEPEACSGETDTQGQDTFFIDQGEPCDSTNAIEDTYADDWETIWNDQEGDVLNLPGQSGSYLLSSPIIVDSVADSSVFTTGGSKDVNDISEWQYTEAKPTPDKNNILHAFAAVYLQDDPALPLPPGDDDNNFGDIILYYGLDRLANNGAADVGFWVFTDPVNEAPDGTFVDDLGNPSVHSDGDVLILSNFTQGGVVSTVKVYQWQADGLGSDGFLNELEEAADCDFIDFEIPGTGVYPSEVACGNVNTVAEEAPWRFDPKFDNTCDNDDPDDPTDCTFPPGSFYEGGINLSLLGLTGCFSNFLAETRSSPSLDAQLKDYVLGDFSTCGISVEKTGPDLVKVGDTADYTVTINNTGIADLYKETIIDTIAGDLGTPSPNANVSNVVSDCGPTLAAMTSYDHLQLYRSGG